LKTKRVIDRILNSSTSGMRQDIRQIILDLQELKEWGFYIDKKIGYLMEKCLLYDNIWPRLDHLEKVLQSLKNNVEFCMSRGEVRKLFCISAPEEKSKRRHGEKHEVRAG
jgi:hypothetical protein